MENKYFERRFLLPLITILIGASMVFLGFMTGTAWAAMSGTLVSGYFGLSGWVTQAELKTYLDTLKDIVTEDENV